MASPSGFYVNVWHCMTIDKMSLAIFLLKKKQSFCDLASCILCPRPDKQPSICRQIVMSDFLADSLAINEIKELQCFSVSINFPLGKIGINHWLFSQARQYIFFARVINKGEKIQSTVLSPKDNPLNFYTQEAPFQDMVTKFQSSMSFKFRRKNKILPARWRLSLSQNCLCFGGWLSAQSGLHPETLADSHVYTIFGPKA